MSATSNSLKTSIVSMRKALPLPIRRAFGWAKRQIVPHPIWDSKEFQDYFAFLQGSQWWSLEKLREFQLEQLRTLIHFAYEKVPYYQRSFKERRLKPSDIRTIEDLQLLPLISKEEVREHINEFIPTDVNPSTLRVWVTGGSSGVPLKVYLDDSYSSMIEEAFSLRQRLWGGYKQYDRKVNLTRIAVGNFHPNRCWDYNTRENEIILKSHDMGEKNMFEFAEVIETFKPLFIVSYPSALEIFARFIHRNTITLPPIKAVFSGSESLFPSQRNLIESALNCKVFSGYGMSERVADAIECEHHCGYHINMEYGIFELLDKNNEPISKPYTSGVVVGTGFHNNVMPLIRYQMFDIAAYSGEKCPCKRNSPLVKSFKGRFREYFVGRSGKLVPLQLAWSGRHPVWSKIREMKFEQDKEGKVIAKIVRAHGYQDEKVAQELREQVRMVLTEDDFEIEFQFVESLPLTHRGKLNFLDQKIPLDFATIADAEP
jgi:phenylacetate-CoA ligase